MLATPDLILESAMPERLGELLPRWVREVPLYARPEYDLNGSRGGAIHPQTTGQWPLITKADIRRNFPRNFLRASQDLEELLDLDLVELEHTSGTSEQRTPLLLGRGWWAEQEARALRLNPVVAGVLDQHPDARRVTLASPMCNNDICYTGAPSMAERTVGNALFLSLSKLPFLWSESDLARMAAEAQAWDPVFMETDPVYGVVFARYCERKGIRLPSLRFILCSFEFVSLAHRRVIERVFGVPVFNLYGSTETGHLMMELPDGEMRPSLGTASFEVIEPDAAGIGELVVTTLTNDYMPLIRYRIGDLVQPMARPLGTRYFVHGRVADSLMISGRRVTVWHIDSCVARCAGIAHYQLTRESPSRFAIRYVPDVAPPAAGALHELQRELRRLLSVGEVVLEETDTLMPESSGKFRLCYPG